MPHDKNGTVLGVGDDVLIPCKVQAVGTGADYCNLTVETLEPMHPSPAKTTISLNARQVIKSGGSALDGGRLNVHWLRASAKSRLSQPIH